MVIKLLSTDKYHALFSFHFAVVMHQEKNSPKIIFKLAHNNVRLFIHQDKNSPKGNADSETLRYDFVGGFKKSSITQTLSYPERQRP